MMLFTVCVCVCVDITVAVGAPGALFLSFTMQLIGQSFILHPRSSNYSSLLSLTRNNFALFSMSLWKNTHFLNFDLHVKKNTTI